MASEEVANRVFEVVKSGRVEDLRKLLASGEVSDDAWHAKDRDERTVIHHAAISGHAECLHVLIESGTMTDETYNAKDRITRTALHHAAVGGHASCLKILMECGMAEDTYRISDNLGYSFMHVAASRGHAECLKVLLEPGRMTAETCQMQDRSNGQTVLHAAAGHAECLRVLIESGRLAQETYQMQDCLGRTALHVAASHPESLKLLMQSGRMAQETYQMQDRDGRTALHSAASHAASLKLLMESGRMPDWAYNARSTSWDTVLHEAAASENPACLILLIESGKITEDTYQVVSPTDGTYMSILLWNLQTRPKNLEEIWMARRKELLLQALKRNEEACLPRGAESQEAWCSEFKSAFAAVCRTQAVATLQKALQSRAAWFAPELVSVLRDALTVKNAMAAAILRSLAVPVRIHVNNIHRRIPFADADHSDDAKPLVITVMNARELRAGEPAACRSKLEACVTKVLHETTACDPEGCLQLGCENSLGPGLARLMNEDGSGVLRPCHIQALSRCMFQLEVLQGLAGAAALDALATPTARIIVASAWFDFGWHVACDVIIVYAQTLLLVWVGWHLREYGEAHTWRVEMLFVIVVSTDGVDELQQVGKAVMFLMLCRWRDCIREFASIRIVADLVRVGVALTTCILLLQSDALDIKTQALLALWTSWSWLRCLWSLRGLRMMGPRVLPILYALRHIVGFATVLLFTFLAATNAYFIFGVRQEPSTLYASVLVMFRLAVLGEVDMFELEGLDSTFVEEDDGTWAPQDPEPSEHYVLINVLFYIVTLVVTVVLMNLFIGILGSNYDHYVDKSEELFTMARAQWICDSFNTPLWTLGHYLFGQDLAPNVLGYNPSTGCCGWRLFLVPVEDASSNEEASQSEVHSMRKTVRMEVQRAVLSVESLHTEVEKRFSKFEQDLDRKLEPLFKGRQIGGEQHISDGFSSATAHLVTL